MSAASFRQLTAISTTSSSPGGRTPFRTNTSCCTVPRATACPAEVEAGQGEGWAWGEAGTAEPAPSRPKVLDRGEWAGLAGVRGRWWPSNARSRPDPAWGTPGFGAVQRTSARSRRAATPSGRLWRRVQGRPRRRRYAGQPVRLLLVVGSGGVGGAFGRRLVGGSLASARWRSKRRRAQAAGPLGQAVRARGAAGWSSWSWTKTSGPGSTRSSMRSPRARRLLVVLQSKSLSPTPLGRTLSTGC